MLRHLDLFSGCGGFTKAAERLGGIQTTQLVEINPDAQLILKHHFPGVPIHSDIRDYQPEPGEFDLITMGFPCTGTSNAGSRTGLKHPASSLWREGLRVLLEAQPKFCIMEQPQGIVRRGLRAILGGLSLAGYSFEIETVQPAEQADRRKTTGKALLSARESLEHHTKDSGCLSFPTLTSGQTSTTMRPAGQTKCEKWFKDKGLIPNGYQLGTRAIANIMGFPSNWFAVLGQKNSNQTITPSQTIPQEESEPDIWQVEQSPQHKQPLPFKESFISIPCLVKQPKQPEVKGVIKQDLGDRFAVYIPDLDSTVTYLKLFVYPDFDRSDEQIDEVLQGGLNKSSSKNNADSKQKVSDTSDKCSSKIIPPCTKCSSKIRRKKGEGSGHIYYRTVTRNGKDYRQAYYQWRENGKQRTKYIPKKLLYKVEEAEHKKYPVSEILKLLLGGLEKCSSKKFDTFSSGEVLTKNENAKTTANCSSKITSPPSRKKKRSSGYGGGYIEYREVKRNHKTYSQYWYHYEFWAKGDRITKKSRYISKRLLQKVERMNQEKAAVREILEVLISKGKVRQK